VLVIAPKKKILEDVFDEIVKFSDKISWEGGQKLKRKTGFAQYPKMFFIKVVSKNIS
jgi:hypothetical protein